MRHPKRRKVMETKELKSTWVGTGAVPFGVGFGSSSHYGPKLHVGLPPNATLLCISSHLGPFCCQLAIHIPNNKSLPFHFVFQIRTPS